MKHVRVNNANIEPVFFAYPDNEKLDVIIKKYTANKPVYEDVYKRQHSRSDGNRIYVFLWFEHLKRKE